MIVSSGSTARLTGGGEGPGMGSLATGEAYGRDREQTSRGVFQ
jgi:hypothetical protein